MADPTRKRVRADASPSGLAAKKDEKRLPGGDEDMDGELSRDMQKIMQSFLQLKKKAQNDGVKKSEEVIASVRAEIQGMVEEARKKMERERQSYIKAAAKIGSETEQLLKSEAAKFEALHRKYEEEKKAHLNSYEEVFAKFEDLKEKLSSRYEQQRKKDKAMLMELKKTCSDQLAAAEETIQKRTKNDNSYLMLRKSLGSLLEANSDDEP